MQKLLIVILVLWMPAVCFAGTVSSDCTVTVDGKKVPLYGQVKVVDAFADIKVEEVTAFPDLKVKKVTSFPDQCGEWEFVESFPDFTVEFVSAFPDLKVEFVTAFPGIR